MSTTNETVAAPVATERGRAANVTLWVLQVPLAAFFVFAAAPKLAGEATAVQMFGEIGAGQWFRYLVGALEVTGAIGLLIPRRAALAALGLAGVMVGATLTQLFIFGSVVMALTPAVLVVVFAAIAWCRRP